MSTATNISIRKAIPSDVPFLRELIDASVRGLQAQDYTPTQIDSALITVFGVDSQLVADGTYFVAVAETADNKHELLPHSSSAKVIVGCGGWSKRKTLYGSDHWTGREDELLDPQVDAAKIRAFFIHPDWARLGIGSSILKTCEDAAAEAGFTRCEMGATLTGVKLFGAKGYTAIENILVPLKNGEGLPVVRMSKQLAR